MPAFPAEAALSRFQYETDRIDPEMQVILDRMLTRMAGRPPMGTDSPVTMRERFAEDARLWNADPPALPRVEDLTVRTSDRDVPVRLYDPRGDGKPLPAMIYYHGGGWIVGDLDSNDRALRLLAIESSCGIVSVDYCLAPEHSFPAPLDECVQVAQAVRQHGSAWGLDVELLALGGDSAGANLALATAIDLRELGDASIRFLLLMYGAYARDYGTESHRLFGDGRLGFGSQAMEAMWSLYLGKDAPVDIARATPLYADLRELPSACLISAGLDPLRDDSRNLAARLIAVGANVEYLEFQGVVHGFMSMTRDLTPARRAIARAGTALDRALARR